MKRSSTLLRLSREHHTALVLAKKARRAGTAGGEAVATFMAEVTAAFARELEPHFRIEEETLLPALERAGQGAIAERTWTEHETLRALAARIAAGDSASLCGFGDALEVHVRFEERELFPTAEQALPSEILAGIDDRPMRGGG